MITAVINGEKREIPEKTTIMTFLESRDVSPATVVIELNGKIKCREEWCETTICSGDIIEIVKFLGGG